MRRRELDLIANAETRDLFVARARIIAAIRGALDDDGLRRARDAGAAADLRRRAGAPVHDLPQRARPHALSADRDRALPQARDRRRSRARLRARQGLPQRGPLAEAQPRVHDGRVVRGLRRLRGRSEAPRGGPRGRRRRRPRPGDRLQRDLGGASSCAMRSASTPGSTSTCCASRDAGSRRRSERGLERDRPRAHLGAARRRAPLHDRRADACSGRRSSSTTRSSSRRSPGAPLAAAGLVERWEAFAGGIEIANAFTELNDPDEQRARFVAQRAAAAGRRRRGPALRRGFPRGARAGHAADRAGSGSASTVS